MRDGAALCQYLHWLGTQGAQVDEVDVADKAEYFRLDWDTIPHKHIVTEPPHVECWVFKDVYRALYLLLESYIIISFLVLY